MNKLSIRPRNLDACKYLPIYKCEEIPDLNDYASVNRSIPQLPTGMEKEEESEHHLQQAISAQQSKGTTGELVIPTPEVYDAPETFYNDLYPQNFKLSRQLIHVQPFAIEHDIPDYDRDSEDEQWIESQKDLPNLTPTKFEELIDRFDKSSSQHVVSLKEAKSLIKEDEDLIIAVYDYWLNKRLRLQTPLIPLVKTERRDSSTNNSNNPYIAFRRRTEKMQTRKNRKNDEISYEKMIKLKRDLSRSVNLLQLVKQREETKKEFVKLTVDIFEKRYLLGDFNGNIINEISALRQIRPPPSYLPLNNLLKTNENKPPRNKEDTPQPRKKREYRKRHRPEVVQRTTDQNDIHDYAFSSDEDDINDNLSQPVSDQEEDDSDGPYAFKRKKGCQYHAPLSDSLGNWPFYSAEEKASQKNVKKYCLSELKRNDKRIFGYARRRIGRGGRVIFDRAFDNKDQDIDMDSDSESYNYFRPKSPIYKNRTYSDSFDEDEDSNNDSLYIENGNLNSSVPINLNDYLHEEDNMFSNCKTSADEELSKFKSHQKELIEIQKRQKEKQNKYEVNENQDLNQISNSKNEIGDENSLKINLSTCNNIPSLVLKNHSFNSMANSTTCLNNTTSLPQSSTLDSESVQFAVSAVLSTVSSLNNSSTLYLNGPAQINNLEYEKIFSNFNQHSPSQNNSTQQFLSTQQQSQQNQQSQAQWSNQQSNELNNSSNVYKLKFQNNNQNSINSVEAKLTPTDVI